MIDKTGKRIYIDIMYCAKCKCLTEPDSKNKCSFCGYKKIRKPLENDEMYIATKNFVFAGMFEAILVDNGIPHIKQPVLGAGITKGGMIEKFNFYVPFVVYEKAKKLLSECLGG